MFRNIQEPTFTNLQRGNTQLDPQMDPTPGERLATYITHLIYPPLRHLR